MDAERRPSDTWLWLLVAAAVCTQTAIYLVRPLTTYRLLDLGAGAGTVGVVTAVFALVPLVAALGLGRLSDRTGRLRLMVLSGVLILTAGAVLLAAATSVWLVAAANAVLGIGHLVFTIAGQSAIARYAGADRLDFGFGWFTAAYSAGQMLGPLGVTALISAHGPERSAEITAALWLGAAVTAAAVPLLLLTGRTFAARARAVAASPQAGAVTEQDPGPARTRAILADADIRAAMLSSLSLLAILDILVAFLPLLGEEHGVAPAWIGLLLAVRGVSSIASRVFLPQLTARFDRRRLVFVSVAGAGLVLICLPLTLDQLWLAALAMLLSGFFLGLGQPLTMALITAHVPAAWRGSALALRLMGNRIGQVAMPLIAGAIAGPVGPAAAIWCGSGLLLLAAGTQHRRNRRDEDR